MTGTRKRNRRRIDHNGNMAALRQQTAVLGRDLRHLAEAAGETVIGRMDPLEAYIRERPIKSLLMAAGAGALLGFLFLRR
jgi:ElaB/YqjD/DUF883 family membrane-anchored ribosome-binding protein